METVIIGAGLAGLSAAYHLGGRYVLLEKADSAGGLCRSFVREGFTFDVTGHWLHLRDDYARGLVFDLLRGNLLKARRRAAVSVKERYIGYPFQANVAELDRRDREACMRGAREAEERRAAGMTEPENFHDWCLFHFGAGISRLFMLPYNRKFWAVPLETLTAEWCGRFVPLPKVSDMTAAGSEGRMRMGYNAEFYYPARGGIEALVKAFERRVKVKPRLKTRPLSVDWRGRRMALNTGEELSYRACVATAPLPDLAGLLKAAPASVKDAAALLRRVSVTYYNIGVAGASADRAPDFHWAYFPQRDLPFYRAGQPHEVSDRLVPAGSRSFYVEVSGANPMISTVLRGLKRCGLILAGEKVVFAERRSIPCAYVLYDANWSAARGDLLRFLERHGIFCAGRYGRWEYSAMEDAILEGREAAKKAKTLPKCRRSE